MLVELIVRDGKTPRRITVEATQIVVRNNVGTALVVAQDYGAQGTIASICENEEDFNKTLRELNIQGHTQCTTLQKTR